MGASAPRRKSFAEELRLNARDYGFELSETYEFHFRRRYNLPPSDPRFLDATREEIVIDYWAHAVLDNPKLREETVNPDFENDVAAFEAMLAASKPKDEAATAAADWEVVAEDRWS